MGYIHFVTFYYLLCYTCFNFYYLHYNFGANMFAYFLYLLISLGFILPSCVAKNTLNLFLNSKCCNWFPILKLTIHIISSCIISYTNLNSPTLSLYNSCFVCIFFTSPLGSLFIASYILSLWSFDCFSINFFTFLFNIM